MHQGSGWRAFDRKPAKNKGAGGEAQVLAGRLAAQADTLDEFHLPESPARSDRSDMHSVKNLIGAFEPVLALPAFRN
jgi:hypothetical protein